MGEENHSENNAAANNQAAGNENNAANNQAENNQEQNNSQKEQSTDEKLQAEKEKELKLLQEKNKMLEEQLKGKSNYLPPVDKEKKLDEEVNSYLKGTGLSI